MQGRRRQFCTPAVAHRVLHPQRVRQLLSYLKSGIINIHAQKCTPAVHDRAVADLVVHRRPVRQRHVQRLLDVLSVEVGRDLIVHAGIVLARLQATCDNESWASMTAESYACVACLNAFPVEVCHGVSSHTEVLDQLQAIC